MEPFLERGMEGLWTYYCTGQCKEVSNRFMAMPSARTRILGVQLYLYRISGFLHWGFNFYNSQYSIKHINPYAVTDAGEAFPSGDAFLVYPGEGGVPEESIRLMLMQQVMQDVRACELLESLSQRKRMAASLKRTGERGDRKSNCETIECTLCEHSIVMNKKRRARAGLLPCFRVSK